MNEIEVDESPDGRWLWRVGVHHGEEQSQDAAYDRARDIQRRLPLEALPRFRPER